MKNKIKVNAVIKCKNTTIFLSVEGLNEFRTLMDNLENKVVSCMLFDKQLTQEQIIDLIN